MHTYIIFSPIYIHKKGIFSQSQLHWRGCYLSSDICYMRFGFLFFFVSSFFNRFFGLGPKWDCESSSARMVLNIVQSKLSRDTHVQGKVGLGYVHTVPYSETVLQKLVQYIVNRNKRSAALRCFALQVLLHLLKMDQSNPALEQKLFRK